MATDAKPEAVELIGLAKAQAGEIDSLLQQASLTEDAGCYKGLQAASHSIVDCLLEGLDTSRHEQFQKNFLVIAKSFNTELQSMLVDCFNENHLSAGKHGSLAQRSTLLEKKILSFIRQLQSFPAKDDEGTAVTTNNKS